MADDNDDINNSANSDSHANLQLPGSDMLSKSAQDEEIWNKLKEQPKNLGELVTEEKKWIDRRRERRIARRIRSKAIQNLYYFDDKMNEADQLRFEKIIGFYPKELAPAKSYRTSTTSKKATKFSGLTVAEKKKFLNNVGAFPENMGLAISGGGIRSAAFAIGCMQGLHEKKIMDRFDYMSTVSGGGYAGGALTWFLNYKEKPERTDNEDTCLIADGDKVVNAHVNSNGMVLKYSMEGKFFPFEESGHDMQLSDAALQFGRKNIDYIRQRSSYLQPGAGLTRMSALSVVLRGMAISSLSYLALASIVMGLLFMFGAYISTNFFNDLNNGSIMPGYIFYSRVGLFLAVSLVFIWLAYSFYSAVGVYKKPINENGQAQTKSAQTNAQEPCEETIATKDRKPRGSYTFRRNTEVFGGVMLMVLAALLFLSSLDYLHHNTEEVWNNSKNVLAVLMTLAGSVTSLFAQRSQNFGDNKTNFFTASLPVISTILLLLGLGILAQTFGHKYASLPWVYIVIIPVILLLFMGASNINYSGMHRMYRDRLMETFMPNHESVREDIDSADSQADRAYMHEFCGADVDGPFHLINTHVVLLKGKKARFRSRGGDCFILSPLYSGSDATGWIKSENWLKPSADRFPFLKPVGPMTLPTGVAISGAALNPRTGADGRGVTKKLSISFLLTVLNLRLGYWAPSPDINTQYKIGGGKRIEDRGEDDQKAPLKFLRSRKFPPNLIYPGLKEGLLGVKNENSGWVELTDGGHFDNTGLYELLRRKMKTIVLLDGSADPNFTFSSFANSLEKAFIDLGTTVDFFGSEKNADGEEIYDEKSTFSFIDMVKNSGVKSSHAKLIAEQQGFSKHGFAVGKIIYPVQNGKTDTNNNEDTASQEIGYLFYIKTSMIAGLPARLYSYKSENEAFPDEPTSDQFFTEQQFEAYRILGFYLVRQMIEKIMPYKPLREALGIELKKDNNIVDHDEWPVKKTH